MLKCDGNNGSNHNTISNCSITLNKTNVVSSGIYSGNHTATAITALVYSGTAGNTAQVDSSRNGNNRFFGNSIQNVYNGISLNGNASGSGALSLNDTLNVVGISGQGNVISNFGGSTVSTIGITETNQRGYSVVGNNISGGAGSTSGVTGIQMLSGVWGEVKDNVISLSSNATTSSVIGITCAFTGGSAANPNTVTITGNTVQGINYATATSGVFTGITSGSAGTGSVVNISNNTVQNNTATGTGSFNGIVNTATPGSMTMSNNVVTGNTKSGAGTMTLLDAGAAINTITMNANQVTGNQLTGANGTMYCTKASTGLVTYNGNIVNNNAIPVTSGTLTSSLYGYHNTGFPTIENLTNNSIDNLSIGGGTSSTFNILYGIYTFSTTTAVKNISGNNIHSLSMTTAGSLRGISQDLGASVNIYRNKIYDLSNTSSNATVLVEGVRIVTGNVRVYNNMIGDLRAAATSAADAVRGISSTSTTANSTIGLYFNTIYLGGTSTGTGFGSSGIFHTTNPIATTAALDMRNNIVINACTPTGTGRAVAYRRSSTSLVNFSASSNNNIYYVEPGANNHIFSDGTNHLDLPGYQSFAGISPRDTYSQTENVAFQSIAGSSISFLKLNTSIPTFAESRAVPVSGITDDHFGTVRNTLTPDIGAHEDNFVNAGPIISSLIISPATPQCVPTARTITTVITAGTNPVTSVTLNYSFAGVAQGPITMTGGPVNYTGTLPAAPSPNVLVSWSVTVTDGFSSGTSNGGSFTDAYLTGMSIAATASPSTVCSGNAVLLSGVINTSIPTAPPASSYCTSTHISGCSGDNITNVLLGTINNATTGCGGTSHYTYFNGGGTQTTSLAAAVTNTLSVSFGSDGNQYFGAWIDYDHNGVYDASEFLGASGNAGANGTVSVSFVVPVTANNGLTHIRIVGGNDLAVTATQACGASSSTFGETQDYDVTITGATPAFALPVSYTWKNAAGNPVGTNSNSTSITPTTTDSYTLTVADVNGCSVVSPAATVIVNPLPEVNFTGLPTTICSNAGAVTLTGTPAGGVFSGTGISGNTFDPAVAGVGGPYTIAYTYTNISGCTSSSSATVTVTNCVSFATLNLHVFLEGFYMSEGTLQSNLSTVEISTDPLECDTITVNLWDPLQLSNTDPAYSEKSVLHTDGMATVNFPQAVIGNNYYVAVKHRNHVETWSHDPVLFSATTGYNFTQALSAAYDDGVNPPMKSLGDGNFGMYAGDINQDGTVDGQDMNVIDNNNGFFGYDNSDINGDGGTDGQDMNFVDNNSQLSLFYARPY